MTDDRLVALAERLYRTCLECGLTVATAESCTGGLVAHAITEIAGSSAYFRGGFVTYADDVKHAQLVTLDIVGVGDEPAPETGAGSGDLGDRVGDQTAGTRFGGGDGEVPVEAGAVQALGQGDEAVVGHPVSAGSS